MRLIETLSKALPDWHFEPYGKNTGVVACYPPQRNNPGTANYDELATFAFIDGVCGPLYTVSKLRE